MESEPSSSLSDLGELDTPESLNRAYLYSDSALSDDADISHLFPMAVPVTPSPVSRRRRRRSRMAGNLAVVPLTSAESGPVPSDPERKRPVDPVVTPSTRQRQKRRRLQTAGSSPGSGGESSSLASDASASAPAPGSSRRSPPWCPWLESPLPSAASSSASSVSSACSRAPSPLVNGETSGSRDLGGTAAPGPAADHRASGTRRARRPKRTQTASSRTRALRGSGGAHRRSAAASRAEGEGVSFVAQMHGTPAHAPLYQIEDEVVIIDDDDNEDEDDGVVVETVVRSIQMEEDEAFARSLQEQFDREEQLQQEWRSPQAQAPPHDQSFEPFFGLRWLTPRATPMDSSSFLSQFPQLERILGGPFTGRGRNSAIGRAWGSRQRRANQMLHNILDDSQGNNYEALLALEEGQGVVVKKTMSKRQIDQLPTRAFDLAHSTGQTQCQICLSDYTHGERLRVLPCLHDYHAKCVDSWLKENATCPICRADAEEGGAL